MLRPRRWILIASRSARRLASIVIALACVPLAAAPAHATGRDFIGETLVASGLGGREMGLELGADSRLDRGWRLQGWFTPELEIGVTRAWLLESAVSLVDRGRGLELAAWRGETRYVAFEQPRLPVSVAFSAEYETEERAAKHLLLERRMAIRAIASRTFAGSLLATVNGGFERRFVPFERNSWWMYAVGVRYPEDQVVTYGAELRRDPLEREAQAGPEMRIALPHEMTLRIGALWGRHYRPYHMVARAILETEL